MGEEPEDMIREFDKLDPADDIQVLFLGISSAEYGIDPMRIYEESGIATFNMASSGQPVEISYHLLKRAFNRLQPKNVFFDVSKLFKDVQIYFDDVAFRYILDSMPFGKNKVELAKTYAAHFPENEKLEAFVRAFFPICQFHERWKELSAIDFSVSKSRNRYRKGYCSQSRIEMVLPTIDLMNEIAYANYNNTLWVNTYVDGVSQSYADIEAGKDGVRLYQCEIQESALEVLLKMKALCEENGAELIMIKIPQIYFP